jgi:hypothetical protein
MKKFILPFFFLFALCAFGQYPSNGLIGYWPFHGNANDISGYGNHGTVHGAALDMDKYNQANEAYYFDGVSGYIEMNNDSVLNPGHQITMSAWVYLNSYEDHQNFVSKSYDTIVLPFISYSLKMGINGGLENLEFQLSIDSVRYILASHDTIPLNQWVHIMGVYDGSDMKIFINGLQDLNTIHISGNITSYHSNLNVGRYQQGNSAVGHKQLCHGRIDEVGLWDRALSLLEIQSVYTGISSLSDQRNGIQIYPNPARDFISIDCGKESSLLLNLTVYNVLGQDVYHAKVRSSKISLQLSDLPSKGIYMIQISDEKGAVMGCERVVVE